MANYANNDRENPAVKGLTMVLGGMIAIGAGFFVFIYVFAVMFMLFKATLALGMIGGGLYLGYKVLNRDPALPGGDDRRTRALSAGDSFEAKMRRLEQEERALDAEISRR